MIKYCNWLQKPKFTSLHINSGAHGGYNEEDNVYYEPNPEFFERDKKRLERLAPKINLPVSLHQITYEDGPLFDVEATLIINAFCFSFDYTPQDYKDHAFWTFIKGNFDWIKFSDDKYNECDIDKGRFCYSGIGK